uniref:R-spondin 3 n=1 Tax=Cyprinodon variegatus TaxID=28743 RepID=A0A3Q2CD92_CYPVA
MNPLRNEVPLQISGCFLLCLFFPDRLISKNFTFLNKEHMLLFALLKVETHAFIATFGHIAGCATCSPLNGCLSCKPRFFFHLELDGIQQRGTCLSSCPRGHYGMRSPQISTCIKCPAECELCVERNNCTRCRADMYQIHGQCNQTCPRGFEPDVQLMQCIPPIHCEVGEWTSWGQCVRKQNTTVHRRGEETRTRQILHPPSTSGDPCPHLAEIRKCAAKKKQKSRLE